VHPPKRPSCFPSAAHICIHRLGYRLCMHDFWNPIHPHLSLPTAMIISLLDVCFRNLTHPAAPS
jgi:hypothetical protein